MKVQVEELSPVERKLSIEVPPEQVQAELGRAYAQLGRSVRLPGFRPGKVPRRILEQRFKGEVEDDVTRRLVERAYLSAISEHHVDAVGAPQLTPVRLDQEKPFAFEARVEVRPRVEPKDYRGLPLKHVKVDVTDAQVDERLEAMRQRVARLEPVEGRTVAETSDFAIVDYTGSIDGKPFPGSTAEDVTVEVAAGDLMRGNVPELAGTVVGQKRELDHTFAADDPEEARAGKTAKFSFTLKGLKRQLLPPLDDDFAKEVGGGETLAELRVKVRGDLETAARNGAAQDEREQLVKGLVERNPFDLPKAMIERGLDAMLDGALRMMARQGLDPSRLNLDFASLREEMRPKAEAEVRGALLLQAVAEKEGLSVKSEDLDARIAQYATESGAPLHQVRKAFKEPEQRKALEQRVREEKTVEFLKAAAKDEG
ncbi:MAG TPA: trigger factor [Myxococcaceae bacterium]